MEDETKQFIESYKIRKRVVAFLKRYEWVILISLTVISWVTGYIGFWIYFKEIGEVRTMSDIAYVTFQLFTFESGFIDGHAPLILDFARFLAPFTLAYAAFIAFMWFIEHKYKLLKLKWFKNHTVIIGLGKSGMQLLKNMQKEGEKIVVVTKEELPPADRPDHKNTIFIAKNIKDDGVLEQIRIGYAKYVMCMADEEQENLSVGNFVSDYPKLNNSDNKTKIFIQASPYLIEQLQELEFGDKVNENYKVFGNKVHYFSIYDRAARMIAQEYAPDIGNFDDFTKDSLVQAHIIIAGFEELGQAMLLQAGRMFHFANRNKMKATIIHNNPEDVERFSLNYPGATNVIDMNFIELNEINKRNVREKIGNSKIHRIFICFLNETFAIEAYNKVILLIPDSKLVFCHENPDDFSERILWKEKKAEKEDKGKGKVIHFKLYESALVLNAIVKADIDKQAMVVHQSWQDNQDDSDATRTIKKLTLQDWVKIPEHEKNGNRNQADHIMFKVRAAGFEKPYQFIDKKKLKDRLNEIVELLAEVEHRRWNADKLLNGWVLGEKRIEPMKIHTDIVPYEKLNDPTKKYDRIAVTNIPIILASMGSEVTPKS